MAVTLDLINQTLAQIGERPLTTSTGSLGGLVKRILTTALYKVVEEVRPAAFEQYLTLTATNDDYLVPIGQLPNTVAQVNKVSYRYPLANKIITLKEQPLELLTYAPTYSIVGNSFYLSPQFKRPVDIFISVLNVPTLTADDVESGIPEYLVGALVHTAASILCVSYLDDANAAAIQRNIAAELIINTRNHYGITRGKAFNWGSWNV